MTFLQIIDCKTNKVDDLSHLLDTWVEQTKGKRTATHSIMGRDRANTGHYVEIIEFASYEEAMRNSQLPETDQIFREMVALCDEPPKFTDLDVVRDEQLNKATVRRFFEELTSKADLAEIDQLFAAGYRDHDPTNETDAVGAEGMRREIAEYRTGFDFAFTVEDQLAEGDEVATRWTWHATHKGDFRGMPATGRKVEMIGQTIFTLRDGRITEGWWNPDVLGLVRQLSAIDDEPL
jgi:steroid delta-isomerase-like uncharacterized protein